MNIILSGGVKDGHVFRVASSQWFPQTLVFDDAGAYLLYQVRPTTPHESANAAGDAIYTHRPELRVVATEPDAVPPVGALENP